MQQLLLAGGANAVYCQPARVGDVLQGTVLFLSLLLQRGGGIVRAGMYGSSSGGREGGCRVAACNVSRGDCCWRAIDNGE
eukprot:9332486-Pyramimonas_sp.AAC.1